MLGGDAQFLLKVLSDGEEHELGAIMQRSFEERGHGLTVHSRASTLRRHGYLVKNRIQRIGSGRVLSYYRLLELEAPAEESPPPASVGLASSPTVDEYADFPAEPLGPDLLGLADAPPGGPLDMPGEQLSLEAA